MTHGLFFELPEDHSMTRALSRYTQPGKLTMRDDSGMTTGIYRCEAGGRFHRTFMEAAFDTRTGLFDLAVVARPEWRFRDLFNRAARASEKQTVASAVTLAQAQEQMRRFEERCAAAHLPLREGALTLPAHYSLAKDVRDFTQPPAQTFATARAALDSLKPR